MGRHVYKGAEGREQRCLCGMVPCRGVGRVHLVGQACASDVAPVVAMAGAVMTTVLVRAGKAHAARGREQVGWRCACNAGAMWIMCAASNATWV